MLAPYFGGDDQVRTGDLRFAKPVLYQLSYTPMWLQQKNRPTFVETVSVGALNKSLNSCLYMKPVLVPSCGAAVGAAPVVWSGRVAGEVVVGRV